ncbi:EPIDERMAL PATTERNING FACTOR-like protein [Parasponia andersonii]|uniref:Epidermal patterning factor-like protein n=1 Tax=Parasponia andersonii TaxID=3476 RepID=A0A2P5BDF6_PARAD|nr:EPIDERMAL PATTERNING FACTOR-like protein [Parasponia andersonii]
MNRKVLYFLMAFLSWFCVTKSRESYDFEHQQDQIPQPPLAEFDSTMVYGSDEEYRSLGRLGSTPPNCAHKCEGCQPCYPVQIPATTDRVEVQIANYEPEGWKCKCGASFFNP